MKFERANNPKDTDFKIIKIPIDKSTYRSKFSKCFWINSY